MKKDCLNQWIYGIRRKLLLYVMALILFVMVLVTVAASAIAGSNARRSLEEQYSYVNDKYYSAFQKLYDTLDTLTENCITNSNVQDSLMNRELSAYDKEVIFRTLQFIDQNFVSSYLYIDNKNNIYSRSGRDIDVESLKENGLFVGLGEEYSKVRLFWGKDFLSGEGEALFAARYVRQFDRDYAPGVIYLRLDDSAFESMVHAAEKDAPAYFLLNNKGKICKSSYPEGFGGDDNHRSHVETEILETLNSLQEEGDNAAVVDGVYPTGSGLAFMRSHEQTGFSVVTFVPDRMLYEVTIKIVQAMVIVFFIVLFAAFILSRYFAGQFTRPIRYVSSLMEQFDDSRMSCYADLHTNTELDDIGNSYNKMLKRIRDLIIQITYKERELRQAELDTLLYQIHPHFLYNTLDTVYMLARISKEETIMKMIQSLSTYLRINLSNGAEEISIEEELRHVQAYLDIQNIRKSDLFTYEIAVDDEIKNISVIKMILQPVAENCIKHGIEEGEESGKIWIRVRQMEDDIVFMVENNGQLISEKDKNRLNRLEKVELDAIDSVVTSEKGGYGICNVVKRLRLRYEEKIRFYYVVSAERTSCIIKIKKAMMTQDRRKEIQEEAENTEDILDRSDENSGKYHSEK